MTSVFVCVLLLLCFLHQNILQLWVFSFSVYKANKRNQKPWETGKEQSKGTFSFVEKARHWLNFKEKLMDLFLLTIFIEQSTEPGAKKGPSLCYKQISSFCWGFYRKMRLLHLIVRNNWLRKKEKEKVKTSVLQVSL